MITLTKSGNAIVFTFDDNDHYLNDGTIEVPVNSLTLVTDDSQMATFRKSASNDIFISATYDELGMSKADLETFYKENMVGSTGGGGGVTPEEVEEMISEATSGLAESSAVTEEISEAVSGKADTSAVTQSINAAVSGKADTSDVQEIASEVTTVSGDVNTLSGSVNALTGAVNTLSGDVSTLSGSVGSNHNAITAVVGDVQTLSGQVQGDEAILTGHTANTDIHVTASDKQNWNNKSDFSGSYNDLTDKPTIPVVPTNVSDFVNDAGYATSGYVDSSVSGKVNTTDFNTYSASTDARLAEDEEVTSAALNELNDALDDKADTTAVTESINASVSGKADTSAVTASITAAVSGKQDTLVSGTNIKTINNESLLGSGNIDIQGGGKAISAGTNISVTTGETADTVNCTLPFIVKGNGIAYNNTWGNIVIGNYSFSGSNSILTRGNNSGSSMNSDIIVAGGSNKFTGAAQKMLIAGDRNEIKNTSEGYSTLGGNGIIVGQGNKINYSRHNYVFGDYNSGSTSGTTQQEFNNFLLIFGERNKTNNTCESTFGRFNNSVSGSSTFGDSGNTLFSVGNGTADNARHNAFEIRQNGDIYITSGGTDIKLQDNLGGGGGLPESAFTTYTASTEARLAEDEEVTAAALNILNSNKQNKLTAGENITINGDVISAAGGNNVIELTQAQYDALTDIDPDAFYIITDAAGAVTTGQVQTMINDSISGKADTSAFTAHTADTTIHTTSAEKASWNGAATNASNAITALGGLKLVQLTQAEYDALATKDASILYIITGSN